jgi:hypothetical protein
MKSLQILYAHFLSPISVHTFSVIFNTVTHFDKPSQSVLGVMSFAFHFILNFLEVLFLYPFFSCVQSTVIFF